MANRFHSTLSQPVESTNSTEMCSIPAPIEKWISSMSMSSSQFATTGYGPVLTPPLSDPTSSSHSSMDSSWNSVVASQINPSSLHRMPLVSIQNQNVVYDCQVSSSSSSTQSALPTQSETNSTDYIKPNFWCSVFYYELDRRFGDVFNVQDKRFTINGFHHHKTKSDRFCLGSIRTITTSNTSNSATYQSMFDVEHTQTVNWIHRRICHGIELTYDNYNVTIKPLSDCPVYVCSPTLNETLGFEYTEVLQMVPGNSLTIFDGLQFADTIRRTTDQGYKAVHDLVKKCNILISFNEGWGIGRQEPEIRNCPCWVSIKLHEPLVWLDKVLVQLKGPTDPISSVS